MPLSDEQRNDLARAIQHAFPLEPDPWSVLAANVGARPEQVREQVRSWKQEGLLREVSAILEGSALGYESALVAGAVPHDDIERVAAIVNEHPTVTHNYLREHAYNLWFTIAVPREMGIEPSLERLAAATGVPRFHALRRTKTFKIGVNFDLRQRRSRTEAKELHAPDAVTLDERTRELFRALQTPLELTERPFAQAAELAGTDEHTLLDFARSHLGGAMRRYVGTFHHRRLGVEGNGMAVWNVPDADQERVGAILARAPEVSHCYARETIESFPWGVYSMIHGPDRDAVNDSVRQLAAQTGIDDVLVLFSTREFKKCRLRYFLPELDRWWAAHPASAAA